MSKRIPKPPSPRRKKPAAPAPADAVVVPLIPAPPPSAKPKAPNENSSLLPWLTHQIALAPSQPALAHLDQEWLLTNGTGAYAMGTVPGINTRRYHGLLVASRRPPVGRIVALNQVHEQLVLPSPAAKSADQALDFSALAFHDPHGQQVVAPSGYALLQRFEKGLCVRWCYAWGQVQLVRELYLHWKEQAATLRYCVRVPDIAAGQAILKLAPMLTLRDFHGLLRRDSGPAFRSQGQAGRVAVHRADLAVTLDCAAEDRAVSWRNHDNAWWYHIVYPADAERGQDCAEDYFVPGCFEIALQPRTDNHITLSVALGERPADPQGWTIDDRVGHLQPIVETISNLGLKVSSPAAAAKSTIPCLLALAADDFIADRIIAQKGYTTILAGYPWFADWGRDSFIALPGLLLTTGRFEQARSALHLYAQFIRDGLVPNRFDDYDDQAAHYNAVDASLWFIHAALEYVKTSGDHDAFDDWLAPACLKIMDAYIKGTSHGIRLAGDGLISAGTPQTQLTWMDAACNGVAFTPRPGKAVEINALWYHLLVSMAQMVRQSAALDQRVAAHYLRLADRIRRSFLKVFWDESRHCLFDHVWVDPNGREFVDRALRPNQIFAASLPVSPVPRTKQVQILSVVRQYLLTPVGLRTLPVGDPNYHGRYTGNQFERDQAYHQGTIWPWLIGPYAEAVLRTGDFSPAARQEARAALQPLLDALTGKTLGQLHEIYEADTLRPVGCMAQAWSVAEMLRLLQLLAAEK